MNRCEFVGRVAAPPVAAVTREGDAVARIAVSVPVPGRQDLALICTCWGDQGGDALRVLRPGDIVRVEGSLWLAYLGGGRNSAVALACRSLELVDRPAGERSTPEALVHRAVTLPAEGLQPTRHAPATPPAITPAIPVSVARAITLTPLQLDEDERPRRSRTGAARARR